MTNKRDIKNLCLTGFDKSYMSCIDNPFITLDLAKAYLESKDTKKFLETAKIAIKELSEEHNCFCMLEETLEQRIEQILYLTDYLPDDFSVSIYNCCSAIFKMAIPFRVKGEGNEREFNGVVNFLNNYEFQIYEYIFDKNDTQKLNVFGENKDATILRVQAFAKAICWGFTPVGRSLFLTDDKKG